MSLTPLPPQLSRRRALLALLGALPPLAGCGGGTSLAGLSSGGTGSFTTGTVSGLASIIVSGVRYDIAQARVLRDGVTDTRVVQPGMVVSIAGSAISSGADTTGLAQATASEVLCDSEWTGPVEQVGPNAITVLGNVVDILTSTVFEGRGIRRDWSELVPGDCIEVFGWLDLARSRLLATRIELLAQTPPEFRLSGVLNQIDAATQSLEVGGLAIRLGSLLASSWQEGQWLKLRIDPRQVNGQWLATRIDLRRSTAAALGLQVAERTFCEGTVSSMTSPTSFSVNGLPVLVQGTPLALEVGSFVRVQGTLAAEQLLADRVEVVDRAALQAEPFIFLGRVNALTLAAQGGSFVLQGLAFAITPSTQVSVPGWISGATPMVRVRSTFTGGQWVAQDVAAWA